MNELCFAKMIQKNRTKLAVLSVIVGTMIFLIPILTEKADARTTATVTMSGCCFFYDVRGHMTLGKFVVSPTPEAGPIIKWVTAGNLFLGGSEVGSVTANVRFGEVQGAVEFKFSNPHIGPNTCDVKTFGQIKASCSISRGSIATATYHVSPLVQENENNHCDILNKFGGEKTKVIRDKLNC
jgi:hypothetical protein